jgi:hypothetical protein
MKVITLKDHWNKHGTFAVGDAYDHDAPTADLILGHVADATDSAAKGLARTGTKAGGDKDINSQEQNAQGAADGG